MDLFKLIGRIVIENDDANKAISETSSKANEAATAMEKIGGAAVKVGGFIAAGIGAASTAIAGLVTASTKSYADYEQLVGGVETLFKDSATTVQKYAKNAYKTAGLSANAYMETVTSFSASLLQSLGGDTAEATEKANMAITDMSDNANKMGTDISMIQNAYQGFAKMNYTMLDNLKLGYGGTQEEMKRLLADAQAISGIEYDISSYADVVDAIHVIQTEMGITGTTAKEASSTISGSIASMKSAWQNLLTAMADDSLPFDEYVQSFSDSTATVIDNLLPRIQTAIEGAAKLVEELAPVIVEKLPGLVEKILPGIVQAATSLLVSLASVLPELAVVLVQQIPVIVGEIRKALEEQFPQLKTPFAVIEELFNGVWQSMQLIWDSVGKPIFEALKTAFNSAKDALQPLIDAFTDYVLEGEFAEDVTNTIKIAIDALKTAYEGVAGFITSIVDGFKDAVTWGKEHETAVTLIAIAIGTLVTAIGAYNAAMTIKNAGGIVELAQLALLQVQIWGLQVAEAAHTAATWLATTATTAFGSAMAFLTSPITLVIAAIGALIAIVVLCVKHWDEIKEAGAKAWEWITQAWENAGEWFSGVWDGIMDAFSNVGAWFSEKFKSAKENVTKAWSDVKEKFANIWNGIKNAFANVGSWFKNIFNGAKDGIVNAWSSVKAKFTSIKDGIVNAFSNIKDKLSAPFTKARDLIKGVADKIKGFFKGEISLPKIKLPHFSVKPKGWKIGDLLKGEIPSLGIDWYAKAINNPMIMKSPTVFGYNSETNSVKVGGEVPGKSEVVSGTDTLMGMISTAVESKTAAPLERVIALLAAILDAIVNGNGDVLNALLAGQTFKVGEREFARLVREYA